jgi:hypothetical protein
VSGNKIFISAARSLFILLIAVIIATDAIKEGFAATSPGTMLQLRTSHVPTQEDEENEKKLLSLINQDLIHMTGSSLY